MQTLSKRERDLKFPRINCAQCGVEFPKRRDFARFCSDKCRVAHVELDRAIVIVRKHLATVNEAAQLAGVSMSTIRRWAKAGKLRVKQHLGRVLVYKADLNKD